MTRRKTPSFTEAQIRKLIRAARAEGWKEVRLVTPLGEVVLRDGAPAKTTTSTDIDDELARFDRGEL
jgi:hypothetical protein